MGYVSRKDIDERIECLKDYDFVQTLAFNNTIWRETRSLIPHKCIFSNVWIMPFNKVVKGVRTVYGSWDDKRKFKQTYWMSPAEFTMQKLKGRL